MKRTWRNSSKKHGMCIHIFQKNVFQQSLLQGLKHWLELILDLEITGILMKWNYVQMDIKARRAFVGVPGG